MATQTPNFNFDLRESADIFNPLSTNANFESLDTILKNLQETGGITTYTTTASANLLKLSGTPKVNDTVFKFVAAGDANTWTAATGGVINNIVALDGKQVTIKGGNMYVAWVNSANAMVVAAWPAVVNAQTFAGKGPNEWASKAQLDTVNQTAANATQTAQAAQTVANNALQVAQAAGFKPVLLYDRGGRVSTVATETINLSETPKNYLIVEYYTYNDQYSIEFYTTLVTLPIPDYSDRHQKSFTLTGGFRMSGSNKGYVERAVTAEENNVLSVSQCFVYAGSGNTNNSALIINRIWTI